MTDSKHQTLYTGVTSNLQARVFEHKEKLVPGFTSRYFVNILVYYEEQAEARLAITRKKQLKGGSRQDKIDLINRLNPDWKDLFESLF